MIHGYITEEFKKFMTLPYSGFLILLLILGLFIMLLNGLIHNGSILAHPLQIKLEFYIY